jgi:hypothetical protein
MRRSRHRSVLVAALVTVSLTGAACTGGSGSGSGDSTFDVPDVYDLKLDPAAAIEPVDATRVDVVPAIELRGLLEQELLWHGIALTQVVRAAATDDPEITAWTQQLSQNTFDLTAAVGLVYGPDAARAFNQQWAQHTQFLVDYAVARGHGDDRSATRALAALRQYSADAGSLFETATDGALHASEVAELLDTHVQHVVGIIDDELARDVSATVGLAIVDGGHLASIGHVLSAAMSAQQPTAFPGTTETSEAAFCTIVTTRSAGYIVALVVTGDSSSREVIDAATALSDTVVIDAADYLGLGVEPLHGGEASVAAAMRRALDQAASTSAPVPPDA